MIPRSAITHWNKQVPWEDIANVEQDLIITRVLTDIFSDEFLASELGAQLPSGQGHQAQTVQQYDALPDSIRSSSGCSDSSQG